MLIYAVAAIVPDMRTVEMIDEYLEPSPHLLYASLAKAKTSCEDEVREMDKDLEDDPDLKPEDLTWEERAAEKAREGYTGRSWTAEAEHHGLTYFIHELVLIGAEA